MATKKVNLHPNHTLPQSTRFCLPEELTAISRRQLLRTGSYLVGFAPLAPILMSGQASAQASIVGSKKLIWINLSGGWDILEATDPKTASTSGIDMIYDWGLAQTVTGSSVRIGRFLPNIAAMGEDLLVIRGLSMGTTSHEAGSVYMNTGILSNAGTVNAASISAIVASESQATIPIIQLGGGSEVATDRGLLNPVSVVRASNLELYRSMYPTEESLRQRNLRILSYLRDSAQRATDEVGDTDRLQEVLAAESKIRVQVENNVGERLQLSDEDRAIFRGSTSATMNGGGDFDAFALTLKLIKNDLVTGINLGVGGFDTHANQTTRLQPILERLDFLLGRLVTELRAEGKLDETLIVLYSDFGRTPKINGSNGRDHWPTGGAMMIGGGIAGGRVVGETDDNLMALGTNRETGLPETGADPISPIHLGGSVLSLLLGSSYMQYRPYLEAIPALTRLKAT